MCDGVGSRGMEPHKRGGTLAMQSAAAEEPIVLPEPSEAVNKRLKRDRDAAPASRAHLHSLTIYVWLRAPGFFFIFSKAHTNNKAIKPVVHSHNEGVFGRAEDHNKLSLAGWPGCRRHHYAAGCGGVKGRGGGGDAAAAAAAGNLPANGPRC